MAGRFSYSRPERRQATDPWFRIGDLDVGSATLLALLCAISLLVYGFDKSILRHLALIPDDVLAGQVWRIATWPLANGFTQELLWAAVGIALLWYFGSRLEEQVGRTRMTILLAVVIIVPGIIGTVLNLPQAGVRTVEVAVLLVFIAEYPTLRFFFGIPAWVLGAVYVVTDILQISGDGTTEQLAFYLLSLLVAALAARSVGLLTAYSWIPRIPVPGLNPDASKPKRSKQPKRRGTSKDTVVEGPWTPPPPPRANTVETAAAQAELDVLLDKISAGGLDSLSSSDKQRLNELSKRLR